MTFETPLYRGWWVYSGLIGLGLLLIAFSWNGLGLWLSLLLLAALIAGALYAYSRGWTPRRQLTAVLSEDGITLLGHPHLEADLHSDVFIDWSQIESVRILPRPGYWQTSILTTLYPDNWLLVGQGLELAETIAEVAGLRYDEERRQQDQMGSQHYWLKPN